MDNLKEIPENYEEHPENIMSNFDGVINKDVEKDLKNKKLYAGYPAWNFYGKVWFENNLWHCMIKRYCSHIETIVAETLEEIRQEACSRYGYE